MHHANEARPYDRGAELLDPPSGRIA
jgi:hypothetical protein